MSLETPAPTPTNALVGASLSGVGTTLVAPSMRVVFDCGAQIEAALTGRHFFLTHAHPDHVGALIQTLFARSMRLRDEPAHVWGSAQTLAVVDALAAAFNEVLGEEAFRYESHTVEAGNRYELPARNGGSDGWVEVMAVDHVIPTLGYLVGGYRLRLRQDLQGLPGRTLAEMRTRGEQTQERVAVPMAGYTGDTTHRWVAMWRDRLHQIVTEGCLGQRDRVYLACEVTYTDDRHEPNAVRYGHTLLSLLEVALREDPLPEGVVLVPVHFSARCSRQEAADAHYRLGDITPVAVLGHAAPQVRSHANLLE